MSKKIILSVVDDLSNLESETIMEKMNTIEFWNLIIPFSSKTLEFIAPNVIQANLIEEIKVIPNINNIHFESSGEFIFEKKNKDEKGYVYEFYVRKNNIIEELDGKLRLKPLSTGTKIGIFVYKFKIKDNFQGFGQNTAELILRHKLREMVKLMKSI